jgi:hypothetical protein
VHERDRAERGLTDRGDVPEADELFIDDATRGHGELGHEIVRMLAVAQRARAVGGLAGLHEQREPARSHQRLTAQLHS